MVKGKEYQILDAIEDYFEENGFSPSIRELCDLVGLKSTSTVHGYLKILEDGGYIKRLEKSPRALRVVRNL